MNRYQQLMSALASHDCWECNKPVPHDCRPDHPNYAEIVQQSPYQLRDALVMEVAGGYGMYFDFFRMNVPDLPVVVLCGECAARMEQQFPNLFAVLRHHEQFTWQPPVCDTAGCDQQVYPNFDSKFCREHQEYEQDEQEVT